MNDTEKIAREVIDAHYGLSTKWGEPNQYGEEGFTRAQAESDIDAADKYPFREGRRKREAVTVVNCRAGFIAGRTVSAETDENVREEISSKLLDVLDYHPHPDAHPDIVTNIADAVYAAAGFIVEEEEEKEEA